MISYHKKYLVVEAIKNSSWVLIIFSALFGLGLLINFNETLLKNGIRRVINGKI